MRPRPTTRSALVLLVVVGLGLPVQAAIAEGAPRADTRQPVSINVLSSRPDLVTGGDAVVEVRLGGRTSRPRVDIGGRDVSAAFRTRPGGTYRGLVTGLALGSNVVTARAPDGAGARLVLTNHPTAGPIFSGPQLQPWTCRDGALDASCRRQVSYELVYRSTDPVHDETCNAVPDTVTDLVPQATPPPCFQPYDAANPPSDVAMTTTDEGVEVPYVVRVERGTVDRDAYLVAVLFDPAQPWDRWSPQRGWNRKLVIKHGSSCGASYGEGKAPDVLDEARAISKGFAVMSTALNNSGHNCNPVLQAESMFMAKEHVIETYGDVRFTMGRGGSGGALAQQWVANAYPGLYDGLLLGQSFPDGWSTGQEIEDCALLHSYWGDPERWGPGVAWTPAQQAAVTGHGSVSVCHAWTTVFGYQELLDPALGRSCGVPTSKRYSRVDNPAGVRCSLQDYTVNVLGRRAGDGFARRPYDNVGIQYGLQALRAGLIAPAQFADLNAAVGSHDIDYVAQQTRTAADPGAVETAYRSGLVNQGDAMDDVAIIDSRGTNSAEIHHHVRTMSMRARLDRSNGHHDNHVSWWGPVATSGDRTFGSAAFDTMNAWLTAIEADRRPGTRLEKLRRNRPELAVDRCTDGSGNDVPEQACAVPDGTPRIAAGAPLTDDVLACTLIPLDRGADYGAVPFTDEQWERLVAAHPQGVCDYSGPGRGRRATQPWLSYAAGPGGQPLGAPARSQPVAGPVAPAVAVAQERQLPATGPALPLAAFAALTMLAACAVRYGRR